jgi:hypothetical protein
MSSTYRVDPLRPGRLVCEVCGRAVATLPAGLKRTRGVTKQQVAARFPELAEQLGSHDVLCRWRQNPWPCSASALEIEKVARLQCGRSYLRRHPGCTAPALLFYVEMHWPEFEEIAIFLLGFIEKLDTEIQELPSEDEEPESGQADAA